MKTYSFYITETLQRMESVEAENIEQAEEIIEQKISDCEIVLDESDFVTREIESV